MAAVIEGWVNLKGYWFHKIALTIFGVSLFAAGIFRHAPINGNIPFNLLEDQLHSLFASITGFSFTVFAFSAAFIERSRKKRILAVIVAVGATGLSILMFTVSGFAGIWQRMIFILSFAWLIFFLAGIE